ncbi:hypothetical protein AB0G85_29620 [Streptomyces sioyaensis]|uniref:hypothetical protein n=1 Tax=Streptomyces sioyaensis TaxID=67364 RepID=UPI0033F1BFB6
MDMATTTSTAARTILASVTLDVADPEAARRFYSDFGVDTYIRLRASEAHSTGFRGFTMALTVSGPATVDGFVAAAVDAGAAVLKPATKSLWGYGGVVRAPDGTIWKIATSAKKDTGPATREIDEVVLLLGEGSGLRLPGAGPAAKVTEPWKRFMRLDAVRRHGRRQFWPSTDAFSSAVLRRTRGNVAGAH